MVEYRFTKAWAGWNVGDRIRPNEAISDGQRRMLESDGYMVPSTEYREPVKETSTTPPKVDAEPVLVGASKNGVDTKRPRGRPRKHPIVDESAVATTAPPVQEQEKQQ